MRLIQFLYFLLVHVLCGNYYGLSSSLLISFTDFPSYIWTNLITTRQLLALRIRPKIHLCHEVKAWEDLWISTNLVRQVRANVTVAHKHRSLSFSSFLKNCFDKLLKYFFSIQYIYSINTIIP